jgi:hypothetical protein
MEERLELGAAGKVERLLQCDEQTSRARLGLGWERRALCVFVDVSGRLPPIAVEAVPSLVIDVPLFLALNWSFPFLLVSLHQPKMA